MKFNFVVAPDFAPERFAGWHMLNTLLQSRSGVRLHLLTPADLQEQTSLLEAGRGDLVYANPFDAAYLIRELGFSAFARPVAMSDEMIIATAADSPWQRIEELRPGCRIAATANHDVKLIGLRLLESADLTETDISWVSVDCYQGGARLAIKQEVDASFFLADVFHSFSKNTRSQLRIMIESAIHDISHVLLAHSRVSAELPAISDAFVSIGREPKDRDVLEALGIPRGFEPVGEEDVEFMVDLMDTLLD